MRKKILCCLMAAFLLISALALPGCFGNQAVAAATGYSNETIIYQFLVNQLGLNAAGACGVLSNLYEESHFDPTAYNPAGYYGIVQWGGGRLTNLKSYCGSSYSTLEGQLRFMKYELEGSYPSTLKSLKAVENSSSGAYNAAVIWAQYYEGCYSGYYASRGTQARDLFWPAYASAAPVCSHRWVVQSYQIEHPHYADEQCSLCGEYRTNTAKTKVSVYCQQCGIIGDVNGDDRVTLADVSLLFRHICGRDSIRSQYLSRGEMNGDGSLTMRDVARLYDMIPLG